MKKLNYLATPADLDQSSSTLADIGELALIERVKAFCAPGAVGDDAALMSVAEGHQLVVSTDVLIENVHFSGRTTPPYSVGWRAIAANLADIAAMGASPLGVTVGLGLPGHTPTLWVEELYRGMADCLEAHGGAIFGGDVCRAQQQTVSITALGQVRPHQVIRRSSAVPGMTIIVTGPHGASRAGLAVLLEELEIDAEANTNVTERMTAGVQAWIKAHQLPVPRFDALASLHQLIEKTAKTDKATNASNYPAIAGMDSSDGLANALLQISDSSKVGMKVVRSHIPLPAELSATVGPKTALQWALYGGEDFELILCLPPDLAKKFTQTPFATAIGTTTDSGIVKLVDTAGSHIGTRLTHDSFQHF